MQPATPQGLAAIIQRKKDSLLQSWEKHARELPRARDRDRALLHDHIPALLDELAEELNQPESARARLEKFCAERGEHRRENGFDLAQVVDEYMLLRRCIVKTAENEQAFVAGEANRVVDELIDEEIKTSVRVYIESRDKAEKKRREEYTKLLGHDLRSPLSAIYYAILLVEREFENAPINERVRNIQSVIKRNIEQMQALISKLLQEEKNVKTKPNLQLSRAPTEIAGVVDFAVRALASLASVSQTRIVNEVPDEIVADVDGDLLERVFQNLISNAIDSTPRGVVTIGASNTDNGAIECWVKDNGKGMAPDIRDNIFEDSETASAQRAGVGLGLPIVKRIIEAHGGRIDAQSEVDKGTTVRFTLPRN